MRSVAQAVCMILFDPAIERYSSSSLNEAMGAWLHEREPWALAVTFTLRRQDRQGRPMSQRILIDTAEHFLIRLDAACFGPSKARRGHCVGSAVSFGWGAYGDNPHLHWSLVLPTHLELEKFIQRIIQAALKVYWIDRQHEIKPYRDQGWMSYLVDHGMDNVILDLVRPSQSV
jgi:hypothetical protein